MFILKVLSFFFVCMLVACDNSVSRTENANQTHQKEKTELSLSMKRSGCYGSCPIYDLKVQPNGNVIFDGKGYTETIGEAEDKLSEEKLRQLIIEIEKADFFSLKDSYTGDSINCPFEVTDHASVEIHIRLNDKEKTINHYLGCWESDRSSQNNSDNPKGETNWSPKVFPQQLYNLENKIDEIVKTKRWIGERK